MDRIKRNLKYIKLKDLIAPFIFIILLIPSLIFKFINFIKGKKLLLVCENDNTARDNGYHFYKYVRSEHPSDYCFYVIDKKCNDYNKVKEFGNIIQSKSLKHWLYYMSANLNISNQKSGNPNYTFWYVIHVIFGLYKNRVFLQHGVLLNDCKWLYYKETKFKYFICGAKSEYNDVLKNYGYPKESVLYTGLARFDSLHDFNSNKKMILIMPTWRNWLGRTLNSLNNNICFKETMYYRCWNSLINNDDLISFIEKNDIKIVFYPHQNMQKYLNEFKSKSKNVEIFDLKNDIQEVLKNSSLMITDYSSVSVDFAYMKKPIIYYQFDENEYRNKQYSIGYFDYHKDGFGMVSRKEFDIVEKIKYYVENEYKIEKIYNDRMINFYPLYDNKNCERIYNCLMEKKL